MRTLIMLPMLFAASSAFAVDCQSVGGHIDGERVSVTRKVTLKGTELRITGKRDGRALPARTLDCVGLAKGVMCARVYGPARAMVMTNGRQMIESVTDANTGQEVVGIAYECEGTFKLRR